MTYTSVAINTSSNTLVFSGVGKVRFRSGDAFLGASGTGTNGLQLGNAGSPTEREFEFTVPTEIYARSQSGASSVAVFHWY